MFLFDQLLAMLTFSLWQFLYFMNPSIAIQSTVVLERIEIIFGSLLQSWQKSVVWHE